MTQQRSSNTQHANSASKHSMWRYVLYHIYFTHSMLAYVNTITRSRNTRETTASIAKRWSRSQVARRSFYLFVFIHSDDIEVRHIRTDTHMCYPNRTHHTHTCEQKLAYNEVCIIIKHTNEKNIQKTSICQCDKRQAHGEIRTQTHTNQHTYSVDMCLCIRVHIFKYDYTLSSLYIRLKARFVYTM